MASGVRSRYNVAINGKGFVLRGSPQSPLYNKAEASFPARLVGVGVISYSDINGSGWRYYAQTDWSGGFQVLKYVDNASFRDGQGIDPLNRYGDVSLQNNFISAVKISGSHKFGAYSVRNGELILGSVKSGAAKVWKLTSANVLSTLSAMLGISAVNSMSVFGDATLIGMKRTSGSAKTLAKYTVGTSISGFRSSSPLVRAVKGIGVRAYISELVSALSGDRISYATNLSAFTSAYYVGKNRQCYVIEQLNGVPFFFVQDGKDVSMFRFDEISNVALPVYTFTGLTNWGVVNYETYLVITGKTNGLSIAYTFNGAKVEQVFDDQLQDATYDFSRPFKWRGRLQTMGAQWDGDYWVPGLYGKYATVQYTPFANFNNNPYGYAITGTNMVIGYQTSAKYQISGNVIGSTLGYDFGAVDKLVNAAHVVCKPLAAGQTIEVFLSTNEGTSYTSIGKVSYAVDGAATDKFLYYPSGYIAKTFTPKIVLVGNGNSTPTLQDFSAQYRLEPNIKHRWTFSVDANEDVVLLNGQREQRDAKALIEDLWVERRAKRTVIFEDIDSCSAKIVSAMTSAATSARVNNTRYFPPQGRIRVLKNSVVEEMAYTSADGGWIKGISRAQRGTVARAYTSADTIDNYYTVVVTNLDENLNNTDQIKTESILRVTLLEV